MEKAPDFAEVPTERYKAFISYSQKDKASARKLQDWLERYRLPADLVSKNKAARRIGRIFRDETDLTAEPQVWEALKKRIAASECLIVLCSPNAAKSEWVDREIRHFRQTGRGDRVFAIILWGEANSGDPETECFPPAFRNDQPGGAEPLAANCAADGTERSFTRIASGLTGLPFDHLWQRERRRQRRQAAFGASLFAFGILLTAAALAGGWFAISGMAATARQSSSIISRESKEIFGNGQGDIATSLLMALQADPAARRNAVRSHFDGKDGFEFARARMAAGYINNRLALVFRGHKYSVTSVAFSPDGRRLATGSDDGSAMLWDAETGEALSRLSGDAHTVTSVAFSPDGKHLATGAGVNTAKLWDSETGEALVTLIGHGEFFNSSLNQNERVTSVAFFSDGTRLATGSEDGTAMLWDIATGEEIMTFASSSGGSLRSVTSVAVSLDGSHLATGSINGQATLWEIESYKELTLSGHESYVVSVAFSPDGTRLATGSFDGTAILWDVATGEKKTNLSVLEGNVTSVAFSPDGRRLVTGSDDGLAKLWDAETGEPLTTLSGHGDAVTSVAFSPDGRRLATGSDDGTARLWDIAAGEALATLSNSRSLVTSVAFSPDGRLLATGSTDGLAKLWDVESGEALSHFSGQGDTCAGVWRVSSVAFSPEGRRLATGSEDGTARLWDVPPILFASPKEQVRMACESLWRANFKLAFTKEDAQNYPVLQGEPLDPEIFDFVSPCKGILPEVAFAGPFAPALAD